MYITAYGSSALKTSAIDVIAATTNMSYTMYAFANRFASIVESY